MNIPTQSHVDLIACEDMANRFLLRIRCVDGVVSFEGDEALAERIQAHTRDGLGELILPSAGYAFLQAVSATYNHPSLLATKVTADV